MTVRDNHIATLLSSKVTVSEPEFVNDPASVATLAVLRSKGGKGEVTLRWQLEDQAKNDLSPLNGTLVFTEVHNKNSGVAVPSHIKQYSHIFYTFVLHSTLQCLNEVCHNFHTLQSESEKTFLIRALADTVLEGDERFTVRLFPAETGAIISPLNG